MAALMEATSLEKGGIYRHFGSKEELAAEAFEYAWRTAKCRWEGLEHIPHRVDRLKAFVANFAQGNSAVAGGCPLLNTAIDADDGNPRSRAKARKALAAMHAQLALVVKEGIARKEINRKVKPNDVATLIISSLEGALMMSRLEKDPSRLRSVRSYLENYLDTQVRKRAS